MTSSRSTQDRAAPPALVSCESGQTMSGGLSYLGRSQILWPFLEGHMEDTSVEL